MPIVLWGMYEYQLKKINPEFLNHIGEYLMGEMRKFLTLS